MNNRRSFLVAAAGAGLAACGPGPATARRDEAMSDPDPSTIPDYDKWQLSEKEWKETPVARGLRRFAQGRDGARFHEPPQ